MVRLHTLEETKKYIYNLTIDWWINVTEPNDIQQMIEVFDHENFQRFCLLIKFVSTTHFFQHDSRYILLNVLNLRDYTRREVTLHGRRLFERLSYKHFQPVIQPMTEHMPFHATTHLFLMQCKEKMDR